MVVAVLGFAAYSGYRHFHHDSSTPPVATPLLPECRPAAGNALYAAPGQVRLQIVNGSLQTGLASRVRATLRNRGFHVTSIGNAQKVGHNVAAIRFSPDQQRAARALGVQVTGDVVMQPVAGSGVLELDLGLRFTTMRSAHAAQAAEQRALAGAAASPAASPSPTPTSSPTCRAS